MTNSQSMYLLLHSCSFVLIPVLYFPSELLPVKLQARTRKACGVQLQHGPQGEHLFVSEVRLSACIWREVRNAAPWEYHCFFLLLLLGIWALLRNEATSKTATSAPHPAARPTRSLQTLSSFSYWRGLRQKVRLMCVSLSAGCRWGHQLMVSLGTCKTLVTSFIYPK